MQAIQYITSWAVSSTQKLTYKKANVNHCLHFVTINSKIVMMNVHSNTKAQYACIWPIILKLECFFLCETENFTVPLYMHTTVNLILLNMSYDHE